IKNKTEAKPIAYLHNREFLLVTGIADPKPLVEFLRGKGLRFKEKAFSDHHNFTAFEIEQLKNHKLILTTEKDFIRLQRLTNATEIYYLPIQTILLGNAGGNFKNRVERAIAAER